MKAQIKEQLYYFKYSLVHPFDGFYEIKFRKKGCFPLAVLLFVLYGVLKCFSYQYTGFVMNENPIHEMNSISIFVSALSVLALFTVSNWTVTTLFNGKGNMKDIFIVVCYSLVPMILIDMAVVFVSNFVIEEEVMILTTLKGLGIVWFVFLLISGLCTIHEYTFGMNLVTLAATFIAAAIIVFIGVLFFTMIEQMVNFLISIFQEVVRRL